MNLHLTLDAKLFWLFQETTPQLTKAADGSAQLTITNEQGEAFTYTGTLAGVLNAAFLDISPDVEQEAHISKVRDTLSALTYGLVESSIEHEAHQALYESESE